MSLVPRLLSQAATIASILVPRVQRHLEVNAAVPSWAPLFAYATSDGSWKHLTKSVFLAFVNEVWLNASLQHIHGHSFRIGGAVELLLAGVPPKVVAVTGGGLLSLSLSTGRRMEEILPCAPQKLIMPLTLVN